ncbi:hypothetical protein L7750_02610 [Xenorhabdus bovienii]|uniref:hypothetical protein n=2 Tax=Xenorhabdus bovienii TaxID=40576 RepID=UPI001EDF54E9|nr:hypothetical protein [Xenorhabdus bovienii]MCG3469326.1 hypothetical protein [Xenorhabdus bovienii]
MARFSEALASTMASKAAAVAQGFGGHIRHNHLLFFQNREIASTRVTAELLSRWLFKALFIHYEEIIFMLALTLA